MRNHLGSLYVLALARPGPAQTTDPHWMDLDLTDPHWISGQQHLHILLYFHDILVNLYSTR